MFRNKINVSNKKDIKGKRSLKHDEYFEKERNYVLFVSRPYEIAHRIAIWLKYYGLENLTYELLVDDLSDECKFDINEKEKLRLYSSVENILKNKYQIKIISKNPLILESETMLEDV